MFCFFWNFIRKLTKSIKQHWNMIITKLKKKIIFQIYKNYIQQNSTYFHRMHLQMFESMKTKKSKNNNITHTSYYGQWNFCHGIPFLCVCLHQLSFSLQNIMILNLERAPFKIHRHCLHAKMRQKLFPPYCWTTIMC